MELSRLTNLFGEPDCFPPTIDPLGEPEYPIHQGQLCGRENMPTYDYTCDKCGHEFSRVESMSDHDARKTKCPKCGSASVTQAMRPFYVKTVRKS